MGQIFLQFSANFSFSGLSGFSELHIVQGAQLCFYVERLHCLEVTFCFVLISAVPLQIALSNKNTHCEKTICSAVMGIQILVMGDLLEPEPDLDPGPGGKIAEYLTISSAVGLLLVLMSKYSK